MSVAPLNGSRAPEGLHRLSAALRRQRFLREALLVSAVYFLYMFTRRLVFPEVEAIAFENADKIISFEASLGLFWEFGLQQWVLNRARELVVFFNWSYIITFWPVIIPTALLLYKLDFRKYIFYRNVVMLSLLIALLVFALFPLAPPRMISHAGFLDTIQSLGPSQYNSRETQVYYNAFAAMPSLHFGWTVLFGIIYFRTRIKWLQVLGVLYPSLTFFAIVITANHYILDAVGGAVVVGIAFVINALMVRNNIPLNATVISRPVRTLLARRPPGLIS
ncbi:MAG: phosphatase PAP2 family protein [Dehalococcoidia bacterium]